MQILRSILPLLRRSDGATSPSAMHRLSSPLRSLLSFTTSTLPSWWPLRRVLPHNPATRRVCRFPHGSRSMARSSGVKGWDAHMPGCPVDGVCPMAIFPKSSHHDGSMYKGRHAWKKEYRIADRNQTWLEPMMLADPTDCCILDGACMRHTPSGMFQIFSLKLAKIHVGCGPVELYGYIAMRDDLDRLLNYVVNFKRDDPIIVEQGSLINMAGPKRGIDSHGNILIEYDMRIKTAEEEKHDLQLIDGASVIVSKAMRNCHTFTSRIYGDCGAVDLTASRLENAVEATLEVVISEVQNSFNLCLSCFTSGLNEEIATYNTVLAACARAADPPVPFDMLLGLFAEMRHDPSPAVRPDLTTYNTLLAAAAVRSLSDQSEMLLHTMLEAGIMPDNASYRYIVDAFANAGDLSRVAELFREMADTGHTPDPSAYLGLMEAHTRIGATAEAVAVLRQMQADGCAPTAATYRVLLDQYGKQGRFDGVRELFREMRTAVPPDTATYNVLFNVFGDGGFFKEVVELFHDMLRTGIEPDMETCEGVLAACGQGGLHEDAREVLDYITKEGMVPTAKAYTGLIEALGHAAMYEEAYVAFNMMTEIGSLPTIETYNSLANVFAKGGLFREAESVLSRMTNSAGIQKSKDSYDALIEAYCQGSQLDDAVKAYMEMRKSRFNPDERSLEGVLNAYCIAGVIDESKEQFEEIRSNMAVPSIIAYCMMLSLYARNDRWADAYDLLEEMKTNRASNTHQVIASMIKGEYDDSSNWQMVEYVLDSSNLEGCDYSLRFFNALLDVLWWFGQKARAARVLDHAVSYGLFPELFRDTKLVWSLDVHRMSVGGALVAVSVWLNKLYARVKREKDLPQLASVVVLRGEMEKSTVTRGLPISKVVYSFLNDTLSASFHYPKWNKGRVICLKSQLKKLQAAIDSSNGAAIPGFVHMTDSRLPPPGSKVYTREQPQVENGSAHSAAESLVEEEKESELLAL